MIRTATLNDLNKIYTNKGFSSNRTKRKGNEMKNVKKFMSLMIAVVMVLAMAVTSFAEEPTKGTITVKNATKGYEYTAYKVFDATYDGDAVSYTTPAANASKLDDSLFGWSTAADENGNISVWVKDGVDDADVIDWVSEHYADFGGTAIPGVFDETDSTVTFSNLDFGYYYITSGLGATVTINTAAPTAEVYDKNDAEDADPTKTIVSVDGTAVDNLTETDAHVGSVIGFEINAITTNWVYEGNEPSGWNIREEWTVTDTPTSMSIDEASVHVYVNGTEITSGFTKAIADSGALTVTIDMMDDNGNSIYPANLGEKEGQIPVKVTYTATVTKDAGETPAKNEIPGTSLKVNTYQFDLEKTDGSTALLGAKFEVYNGETKLTFTVNEAGHYVYDAQGTVDQIDLTEVATATITGLDKWDLTLKEVVVPKGYNQAEDTAVLKDDLKLVGDTTSTATVTVVNKQGSVLPSTGGIGTTLFYVIGAILVLGSGVLMVSKKRMGAN
ncbi:MAG: LPXTG cell wall anchor domain-containing protein [Solobacterium sp.]|nr:LPXTG cell wall anchor domain-containing protein [Solobacterium sp.]